ncbi:hypothetical protein ACIRPU_04945 [Streptomyces sp. NPDC102259]|uniref:hypothetical protein n=1 Tax=Streptomyces sp. NPDC102259 TaxID=3366148 RepID=UPI00381D369D
MPDVADGRCEPAFEAALAHPVGDLLVMDRVILEPPWRGLGLGPVLAGAATRRLSQDCVAVACEPGSADGRELTEGRHREAAAKLSRVWERIGFEPFQEGAGSATRGGPGALQALRGSAERVLGMVAEPIPSSTVPLAIVRRRSSSSSTPGRDHAAHDTDGKHHQQEPALPERPPLLIR